MTKVAFCFPGQGSLEAGMGKDIAEAFPAAREVYRLGSEASGLDLERLCFEAPLEELVRTDVQQPALVATSLAMLAALDARGLRPDFVVGQLLLGGVEHLLEAELYSRRRQRDGERQQLEQHEK